MKLAIAEKLSAARSIASVIGAGKKRMSYLQGNDYLVSWCIGHLVALAAPAAYDAKYVKWRADDLPILPISGRYGVTEVTKPQFNILCALMNDRCVADIISIGQKLQSQTEGEDAQLFTGARLAGLSGTGAESIKCESTFQRTIRDHQCRRKAAG